MIENPTQFRELLKRLFAESPLTIGGQPVPGSVLNDATEEIIWSSVQNYLHGKEPTACEKIVGMFFISLIERHLQEQTCATAVSPSSN